MAALVSIRSAHQGAELNAKRYPARRSLRQIASSLDKELQFRAFPLSKGASLSAATVRGVDRGAKLRSTGPDFWAKASTEETRDE